MKKASLLMLTLAVLLCFSACSSTESAPEEQTEGMANPMVECASLEELEETIDCTIIRPESGNLIEEAYFLIEGDTPIGQYTFQVNGVNCTLRCSKAGAEIDISGVYTEDGLLFQEDVEEITHAIDNDDLMAQRWFTADGQYTFVADDAGSWDWEEFDSLARQFMNVEPRNWDSDVPYADYAALVRYYQNEDGSIAYVSIKGSQALLTASWQDEDGSILWEALVTLQDGKLVYDKASGVQYLYDETSGETTETTVLEEGSGFITVDNGSLIFDGVACDTLTGTTFTPGDIY